MGLAPQPRIDGCSVPRLIAYSTQTLKVLQSRSTPEENQRWHPTRCIRTHVSAYAVRGTMRRPHWLCRQQGSTQLPNSLSVDCGPYGKCGTTWIKTQLLSSMQGAYPRIRNQWQKLSTTRYYARYQHYKPEIQNAGLQFNDEHVMCDNLGIGQNISHRLDQVSASDLYKPDMLHIIYLGLFKQMMD